MISRFTGCTINGHRFHTKQREACRKSQNSGVVVLAYHGGQIIEFYGALIDIIELSYIGRNTILIFKCEWWDVGSNRKINIDEFKFVSVNVTRTWYNDQPFVLASQAQQVFYVSDIKLGKDWRVVEKIQSRNIYNGQYEHGESSSNAAAYQQEECPTCSINNPVHSDHTGILHRREEENILVDVNVDGFIDIEGVLPVNEDDDE